MCYACPKFWKFLPECTVAFGSFGENEGACRFSADCAERAGVPSEWHGLKTSNRWTSDNLFRSLGRIGDRQLGQQLGRRLLAMESSASAPSIKPSSAGHQYQRKPANNRLILSSLCFYFVVSHEETTNFADSRATSL